MLELRAYRRNNNLTTYNPFNELADFEKSLLGNPLGFLSSSLSQFNTDITDEGENYLLAADLPGFEKKDISLDISEDTLTIKAERHSEHEEKDKKGKYVRCERSYGSYSRQFDISGINKDTITAKYENGVLKIILPKKVIAPPESKKLLIE